MLIISGIRTVERVVENIIEVLLLDCCTCFILLFSIDIFMQICAIGFSIANHSVDNFILYRLIEILLCLTLATIFSIIYNFLSRKL